MQTTKNGVWGSIIRDYTGEHVLAGAGNAGQLRDALITEAVSCLKVLETAELHCMASPMCSWRLTQCSKGGYYI